MFLTFCAYVALCVCLVGTVWRIGRWFSAAIGPEIATTSPSHRLAAAARAVLGAIAGPRLFRVLGVLFADVLLQRQIAKQSLIRWIMHMGLFYSVLLLVIVHALDDLVISPLVTDYASTVNPYMVLRNLLGLFLMVGVGIAIVRRKKIAVLKRFDSRADRIALLLLALILISGIALEASQIISESVFDEMVVDYMGNEDTEEIAALKAYWSANFDVVFAVPPTVEPSALEMGRLLHLDFCAACHSRPGSAFVAYPVARTLKPLSSVFDRIRLDIWLWYFHYLVSCLALASLPFGKLFHLVSVPLSLAVRSIGSAQDNAPENRPVRRALGLDACTHCSVCSQHCSVEPIMAVIDNPTILPSEKIGAVSRMARGGMTILQYRQLAQGSDICTACGRCTDVCPSGIDLQDMWQASSLDLAESGFTPPHGWIRDRSVVQWAEMVKEPYPSNGSTIALHSGLGLADNPDTFWACVQCTTCTNVCPVVAASDNPRRDLDLTPQQVMNLMRLELKQMALGCRMVWDCVTCYKCQEHCPQGVPVADVMYELRNEACQRLAPGQPQHLVV
jgi:succinate dehydrogenase/fumarate reductase-like Fe-S protein